jgi:hypothetical protein
MAARPRIVSLARVALCLSAAIASTIACCAAVPCVPTSAQADDPQLFIGGDLGARVDRLTAESQVKVLWLRKDTSGGESLRVQGSRLDGTERVQLTVPAATGTVPWPGGATARGYPSNVRLPSRGCWRFAIVDGKPADMLTFDVRE